MNSQSDPPRLLDDPSQAPEGLRDLLKEARRARPSSAAAARIAAKLPGPGVGPSVPPPPPVGFGGKALMLGGLVLGAGIAALTVVTLLQGDAADDPSPAQVAPSPVTPSVPEPVAPTEPVPSIEKVAPTVPEGSGEAVTTTDEPEPAHVRETRTKKSREAAPPSEPAESEASLLGRAKRAVASNPGEALRLARQHERTFPDGFLAQERELIAVEALLGLGRVEQARARGQRFLTAHPTTAHRGRIEALLEAAPDRAH